MAQTLFRHPLALILTVASFAVPLVGAGPASATPSAAVAVDAGQVRRFLDRVLPAQLADLAIPGAAVTVVAGDETVVTAGYGVADVAAERKVDAGRTGFELGSVAKVLTATAVLQQVERHTLDLDTDVNRYLSRFRIPDTFPGRPVTLRHLLTHTSGFDTFAVGIAGYHPADPATFGDWLAQHRPARVRPPGELPAYDNYGTALAGHLVELASGEPFADYVRRHILRPLGMTGTTFDQPVPGPMARTLAVGHRYSGGRQAPAKARYGPMVPAGSGPVTTAADMAAFIRSQLDLGRAGGSRILQEATARQQHQRQFGLDDRLPGMAFGYEDQRHGADRMLIKDGTTTGFHGKLALLPDRGVGVYVVYNGLGDGDGGGARMASATLVQSLFDTFVPSAAPASPTVGQPVDRYAGTYRTTRTAQHDISRLQALFENVTVTANADGTLTVDGAPHPDPARRTARWRPIGAGLFQREDGADRIAFVPGHGDAGIMVAGQEPSEAYQRLSAARSPYRDRVAVMAGLSTAGVTVLVLPAVAVARRLRRRRAPATTGGLSRAAALLVWTASAAAVAVVALTLMLLDDAGFEALVTGTSPLLRMAPALAWVTTIAGVSGLACALGAWRLRGARALPSMGLTAAGVAALLVPMVLAGYGLRLW